MNRKQQRIFEAVRAAPTGANILFADLEKLTCALGGEVVEGSGSRVKFLLNGAEFFAHRPHPQKEAKKYQVDNFREFLKLAGIKNE
ncbi:MAG: type II toxin-antitoxin system HicA family toxin [Pyrinomonadaceae bacterium]